MFQVSGFRVRSALGKTGVTYDIKEVNCTPDQTRHETNEQQRSKFFMTFALLAIKVSN